jgi:thiol:disulfide interchange protein DsbD
MLLVFFFLGLGMAIPYFLLASSPSFAKLLPKPGPWMATFKEFLSFPLLLTCVWLLWVFHQQTGELGLAWALVGLISIVFGLWLAKKVKSGAKAKLIVLTSLILGGLIGVGWQSGAKDKASSNEISWEKFSPEAVAKAQKDGRNIFIDFTADWCITCKVNERVVFGNENVLQALKAQNVLLLKADWTKRDPQITEELARHGRAGVPLYLLYKPESANPEILPQVLTPSAFLEALQ